MKKKFLLAAAIAAAVAALTPSAAFAGESHRRPGTPALPLRPASHSGLPGLEDGDGAGQPGVGAEPRN